MPKELREVITYMGPDDVVPRIITVNPYLLAKTKDPDSGFKLEKREIEVDSLTPGAKVVETVAVAPPEPEAPPEIFPDPTLMTSKEAREYARTRFGTEIATLSNADECRAEVAK